MRIRVWILAGGMLAGAVGLSAAPRKTHLVALGAARSVPYSKAGDPAGALPGEDSLRVRALVVDGAIKEWTTGDAHDVTDRSFVVRRAIRVNDTLPGDQAGTQEKKEHWVWQRGPWLLVDRAVGHVVALRLPDYDLGVSQVSWFRDYGAYCGVSARGKSLYAVVAQVAARKAVLAKKLESYDAVHSVDSVCAAAEWQRQPLRITFHPAGKDAVSFDLVLGSAVLVEDADDEEEPAAGETAAQGMSPRMRRVVAPESALPLRRTLSISQFMKALWNIYSSLSACGFS